MSPSGEKLGGVDDRRRLAERVLRQAEAFAELTADCFRCGGAVALANLVPTARGFVCERCVAEMPRSELDALVAESAALADELAPGD